MLNFFPDLLAFGLFAPVFLRLTVGALFIHLAYYTLFTKRTAYVEFFKEKKFPLASIIPWKIGVGEFLVGCLLVIGLFTQIVAIVAIYISLVLMFVQKFKDDIIPYSSTLFFVIIMISLSFLFSGAGFFAMDLPL